MPVFMPVARRGVVRVAASPTRNTGPLRNRAAFSAANAHAKVPCTSTSRSGRPAEARMRSATCSAVGMTTSSALVSQPYPQRCRPEATKSPSAPGAVTQDSANGGSGTTASRSAANNAVSCRPSEPRCSISMPAARRTLLRGPSAPTR
jgi:hypothetical protein